MADSTLKPTSKPTGENFGTLAARSPMGDVKGFVRNLTIFDDNRPDFEHTIAFWFRPGPVREQISAVYNKTNVIGMSHQYQNYSHTENSIFSFEIYWNSLMMLKEQARQRYASAKSLTGRNERITGQSEGSANDLKLLSDLIEQDRRFLEALMFPYETPIGAIGSSPSAAILSLPGVCTLRVRLINISASFQDFDVNGNIKELVMNCTFEEAPMSRITMRDHMGTGHFRTWGN